MDKENVKLALAILSTLAAIVVGFVAMIIPPHGIIDQSVLWWSAQLLVFCATLLGISMSIDNLTQRITNIVKNIETEKHEENQNGE